jgi:hypothetical protein
MAGHYNHYDFILKLSTTQKAIVRSLCRVWLPASPIEEVVDKKIIFRVKKVPTTLISTRSWSLWIRSRKRSPSSSTRSEPNYSPGEKIRYFLFLSLSWVSNCL